MTENVYWVLEVAIKPGCFEDFKALASTMVEVTQKNEVGTLNYEWAISDDQKSCHFYERYQDSATCNGPSKVIWRPLCHAICGAGNYHALRCIWHTKHTSERCGSGKASSTWDLLWVLVDSEFGASASVRILLKIIR
jgi:hypothetical protein